MLPTVRNVALTPLFFRWVNTFCVTPGDGPSSKVMANLLFSTHPMTFAETWQGPQSSGQLPHVSPVASHGFSHTPFPQVVVGYPVKSPEPTDADGDGDAEDPMLAEMLEDTDLEEVTEIDGVTEGVNDADPGLAVVDGDALQFP
jgi:hypothetical protein